MKALNLFFLLLILTGCSSLHSSQITTTLSLGQSVNFERPTRIQIPFSITPKTSRGRFIHIQFNDGVLYRYEASDSEYRWDGTGEQVIEVERIKYFYGQEAFIHFQVRKPL